jgi:hypothetical protein
MTDQWWDHSASDNLYVRKMHFSERGTAAYSCWPGQGWDGMWADLSDAITAHWGRGVGLSRLRPDRDRPGAGAADRGRHPPGGGQALRVLRHA